MKIIHCSDIHLDSSMSTHMSKEQASTRNTEIIRSFVRLTGYAEQNDVRAVIIAGDLFDTRRVLTRTIDEILAAIARTPSVDYLYLSGNHDESSSIFADHITPDNLRIFSDEWTTYEYGNLAISGIEISDKNSASLYDNIPNIDDCINIVTMHGQVGTSSGVDMVNLSLLKDRGIDYLALGHLHSYYLGKLDNNGMYCYPGCMEGRGFDECGEKGFVLLTTEGNRLSTEFIPFASRTLHKVNVDITGLDKNSEVAHLIRLYSKEIPSKDMVEFVLTGGINPTANISASYLNNLIKDDFFFCKVKNETRMHINPEEYKNDVSLKGEFIRLVLASDASDDDKMAIIQTGIQALTGEEITL